MSRIHISHQISFSRCLLSIFVCKEANICISKFFKYKQMKSKPFYGFGDYIGKPVRGEMNIFFMVCKICTMNARLCETLDTCYRPEPSEVPSLFSLDTVRPRAAKQHTWQSPMMKKDFFLSAYYHLIVRSAVLSQLNSCLLS